MPTLLQNGIFVPESTPQNLMKNKKKRKAKHEKTKPLNQKIQTRCKNQKIMDITEINNKLSFFNIYIFFCSPLPPILHHCSHENYSWSRLPIEISPSLLCEVSKIRLNADLSNCSWSQSCSCLSRILDYRLPEVPFHLTDSVVPEFSNSISACASVSCLWWEFEGV